MDKHKRYTEKQAKQMKLSNVIECLYSTTSAKVRMAKQRLMQSAVENRENHVLQCLTNDCLPYLYLKTHYLSSKQHETELFHKLKSLYNFPLLLSLGVTKPQLHDFVLPPIETIETTYP